MITEVVRNMIVMRHCVKEYWLSSDRHTACCKCDLRAHWRVLCTWAKRQVDASITGNCHVGAGAIIFSRCGKDYAEYDNLLKSNEK